MSRTIGAVSRGIRTPIIVEGDLLGGVIILLNDTDFNDSYKVVMEVMGNYIVKRLES